MVGFLCRNGAAVDKEVAQKGEEVSQKSRKLAQKPVEVAPKRGELAQKDNGNADWGSSGPRWHSSIGTIMARPWGLVIHGGTSIGSMEVKLKDYLDGATVLFDAAGNVVDGRASGTPVVPVQRTRCPLSQWAAKMAALHTAATSAALHEAREDARPPATGRTPVSARATGETSVVPVCGYARGSQPGS